MTPPLLEAKGLKVSFPRPGGALRAVDGLSLSIEPGRVVGLVGESGCGKSVFAETVLRLLEQTSLVSCGGEINFAGKNLLRAPLKEVRRLRGKEMAIVFQDSVTALHPLMTIGDQIREPLGIHLGLGKREASERAEGLLAKCGLRDHAGTLRRHPHWLSGGMCQRAMIAMAISCSPKLLIADEPTTALDMSAQNLILALFREISEEGISVLLISHDLAAVAEVCDKVAVMYLSHLVEEDPAGAVLGSPAHPCTRAFSRPGPPSGETGSPSFPRYRDKPRETIRPADSPPDAPWPSPSASRTSPKSREASTRPVAFGRPRAQRRRHERNFKKSERRGRASRGRLQRELPGKLEAKPGPVGRKPRQYLPSAGLFRKKRFAAVTEVSFRLEAGSAYGLVGESGGGKSTAGRVIAGLTPPDAGSVFYKGRDV